MGFYGNITNTSKTNFVFDKIYTNRKAMDENIAKDGIFIGRYVLIEYGQITNDSFIRVYQNDNKFYTSNKYEINTQILYTSNKAQVKGRYITNGIVIYTITKNNKNEDVYTYYECNGGTNNGNPTFADNPGLDPNNDPYFFNFNQDKAVKEYDTSRGYDGTVWVKTTVNNEIKYVNIAELNSVVPSFEMVADAPTMSPILPHFDTASNNIYYKLHWQPAWGMRIAETTASTDGFSDYVTSWSQEVYNKETGKASTQWYFPEGTQEDGVTKGVWRTLNAGEQIPTINADIYFNKAAFDPQVGKPTINKDVNYRPITLTSSTYVAGKYYYKSGNSYFPDNGGFNTNRTYYEKLENYIGITADGLSGNEYNLHDGTSKTEQKPDTQQIHISLPAIGNMMSEAWDIIHGPKRDNAQTDNNSSLQGRLDSFKAMEKDAIPMKRNNDGTFVGSRINGNSNRTVGTDKILEEDLSTSFDQDDAWIRTEIDTAGLDNKNKLSGISIHHTWHKQTDTTSTTNKNSDNVSSSKASDKIDLYTPIVDKAGHVVGKNIETVTLPYGYKTIKVTNTEDTVVSEANAEIKSNGQSADNTQDILTLSASNRWIKLDNNSEDDQIKIGHKHSGFATGTSANTYYGLTQNEDHTKSANNKGDLNNDNTFEVPCLKFDEAGHILEARTHTVTLPELFTKVNIGAANTTTGIATGKTATTHTADSLEADTMTDEFTIQPGNKWIQMTADKNNDAFSVQHYVKLFTETTPTAIDYNSASTKQFSIQAIGWDEAGHLTSSAKTTYTLPDGFKTIAIANNGSSTTTFSTASSATNLVAETLTDTATIDTGNRWLTLVADANNDKVTLSHAAAGDASTSKNLQSNNNTSPNFGASFKVLTAGIDQAGHVKNLGDYSITLPKPSLAEGTTTTTGATGASVVTGIVLEDVNTGKFTKTTADIGTLVLKEYKLGTDAGALADSDTINGAMSKLQKQISNEVTNRENAIKALDVTAITTGTDEVFNSISETDGKVDASVQAVSDLTLTNYSVASSYGGVKSGDTLNTAFGQLEKGLAEEKARAQEEENKLSGRITAIIGGVTEAELNTLKEISDALQDDANYYATVNNAIAGVQENLNNTNKNITDNYYTKTQVQTDYILKSEVQTNYILRTEVARDYVALSQYNALLDRVKALEGAVFPSTENTETI